MFDLLLLLCAIGSALIGGVLFAFSVCIMRALGTLPRAQGIRAMQAINVVIINAWFLTVFVGTAALCLATMVWTIAGVRGPSAVGALTGAALYLVGVVFVTRAFNIPRSAALAAVAPESAEAARLWADYLGIWTLWNHLRTVAAIAAALAFLSPRWFGWQG
jgi:uncharacterized membrane protein